MPLRQTGWFSLRRARDITRWEERTTPAFGHPSFSKEGSFSDSGSPPPNGGIAANLYSVQRKSVAFPQIEWQATKKTLSTFDCPYAPIFEAALLLSGRGGGRLRPRSRELRKLLWCPFLYRSADKMALPVLGGDGRGLLS